MRRSRTIGAVLLAALAVMAGVLSPGRAHAQQGTDCVGCHPAKVADVDNGLHATVTCVTCHEGAAAHVADSGATPDLYPAVHFNSEVCRACHLDQYNSFMHDKPGKSTYGGGVEPVEHWPKTLDLPYWNALIDGHGFIIETFEERNMMWNQIDAQQTRRPMAESCITCHGSKVAYYMGLDSGSGVDLTGMPGAGTTRTIKNAQEVWSGNFERFQTTPVRIMVPAGATVSSIVNTSLQHQVESIVTLPDGRIYTSFTPVDGDPRFAGLTITARGDSPLPAERIEARNYIWATLQALSLDGLDVALYDPNPGPAGEISTEAVFVGPNAGSANAAVLCTMCHDPMSARPRLIQKSNLWSIKEYGINPYSNVAIPPDPPGGLPVYDFTQATRQDQIGAVCGQCHCEYVGGYSAVDNKNRQYFPYAKNPDLIAGNGLTVNGLATQYQTLFNYDQDWIHGVGFHPTQSVDPGQRGYAPADMLPPPPLNETLIKVQHPEMEEWWNSPMYLMGATCTDCHTRKVVRQDGTTTYTDHSFTSPVKLLLEGSNPCAGCHDPNILPQPPGPPFNVDQLLDNIRMLQDLNNDQQLAVQMALVDAQKIISAQAPGPARDANVALFKSAHVRWEWHANGENSMGFHNPLDFADDLNLALLQASRIIDAAATLGPPWGLISEGAMAAEPPMVPVNAVSLLWSSSTPGADANAVYNGLAFEVQRQVAPPSGVPDPNAWATVTPAGGITGVVQDPNLPLPPNTYAIDPLDPLFPPEVMWDDTNNVVIGTTYIYRVRAVNGAAISRWSAPTTALAVETALTPAYVQGAAVGNTVKLHWFAEPGGQTGFRVERALDRNFTQGIRQFNLGAAELTGYTDTTVVPGTTYFYHVRAEDPAMGSSPYSPPIMLVSNAVPKSPAGLVAHYLGEGQVRLTWWDLSGVEDGFRVEMADNPDFLSAVPVDLAPNTLETTDTFTPGTNRYYRVAAFNGIGVSAPSNTADTVPPAVAVTTVVTPTNIASQTIGGTMEAGSTVTVSINGGTPVAATTVGGTWAFTLTDVVDGVNTIIVTVTDAGGFSSTEASSMTFVTPNGDVDSSGVVDSADSLKALRAYMGIDTPTQTERLRADVSPLVAGQPSPDGILDLEDVLLILRKEAGVVVF